MAAAAVGASTSPGEAENVTARGEIVAREGPGTGQAGIAVLRGNDRVQLVGQRDGWSEIVLGDGRRAWVPTTDIARGPEPAPVASPLDRAPENRDLAIEIDRLRGITDDLAAWRNGVPAAVTTPRAMPDFVPWAVGAAFVTGVAVGAAFERRRGRRERSLKF